MKRDDATPIVEHIRPTLRPHSDRIEPAGSYRRRKPEVGDIEIVAIPKLLPPPDLFGDAPAERSPRFTAAVESLGEILAGDPRTGRYIKLLVGDENPIQLDLFLARPENWGLIFAIRTGSADFSHRVLASGWKKNGLESCDGMLHSVNTGRTIHCREEQDLFDLIRVPFVPPEKRL
jgi:DNA polymerase/3'-5' exonuclease PolX